MPDHYLNSNLSKPNNEKAATLAMPNHYLTVNRIDNKMKKSINRAVPKYNGEIVETLQNR